MRGIKKSGLYQSVGTMGPMMLPISIVRTLEESRIERERGKESGRKR